MYHLLNQRISHEPTTESFGPAPVRIPRHAAQFSCIRRRPVHSTCTPPCWLIYGVRMCRLAVSMMCVAATYLYRSWSVHGSSSSRFQSSPGLARRDGKLAEGRLRSSNEFEHLQRIARVVRPSLPSVVACYLHHSPTVAYPCRFVFFSENTARNCLSSIISSMPDVKRVKANAVNETFNSDFLHKVKVSEKIGTVYSVCPERCVPHG